jgi:hypothetical protein
MAEKNRTTLKSYFETGKRPTQDEFADLVDSFVNRADDPFVQALPDADTTHKGIVQQATAAEVQAGANNQYYVTPAGAKLATETFSPVKSINGQTGIVTITIPPPIQDSGWINLGLLNNFINFASPYEVARCRKKAGVVYLEGVVKFGGNNIVMTQLPVGFRPANMLSFTVSTNSATVGRINIAPSGDILAASINTAFTSLSGIVFVVE